MGHSYVVTGGGRSVGHVLVERLLADADDNSVVAIELDPSALAWAKGHLAEEVGTLKGWVNNAAVFRDAALHSDGARGVLDLIASNLAPDVVGCAAAIQRFLAAGTGGTIVNVSSHQAQRAVRGALPYAVAKAAIEGLTRALAVDYGSQGIRTNAVALGSITTERYEAFLGEQEPTEAARIEREMSLLHPVGRVGRPEEVAAAISYLLSDGASFINGAILPVDGGRSALGVIPKKYEANRLCSPRA